MPIELPTASPAELQRLDVARTLLLKVHRALLEAERVRYEKARGRIENNSAFLQLVINDPWFDWLRPMAQMVLLIDERTADKKSPLGSDEARALLDRAKALLKADPEGDAFQRLFADALQHSPALAVIARQVATVLHG
jgi:voltage-gated potassium channel Kch